MSVNGNAPYKHVIIINIMFGLGVFQTTHLPMLKLYRRAQVLMKTEEEQQKYSWTELLQKLASGNLVYPWVNPYDAESKESCREFSVS